MIGSQYDTRLPAHTAQRRGWWAYVLMAAAVFTILWTAYAHAASLRVCILDDTNPNIAAAPVFLNGNAFNPDMLAGSTVAAGKRCNLLPIAATLAKGVDFSTTVKYANSVGEVSAASNALPFRLPSTPPVPVLDNIQIVAP